MDPIRADPIIIVNEADELEAGFENPALPGVREPSLRLLDDAEWERTILGPQPPGGVSGVIAGGVVDQYHLECDIFGYLLGGEVGERRGEPSFTIVAADNHGHATQIELGSHENVRARGVNVNKPSDSSIKSALRGRCDTRNQSAIDRRRVRKGP